MRAASGVTTLPRRNTQMAKGTGGGTIYLLALIAAIIVAVALLGIAYWMNDKYEKQRGELKDLTNKLEQEQKAGQEKLRVIAQLNKIIGGDSSTATYEGVAT